MNRKIELYQSPGTDFPLTTETLDFMQAAYTKGIEMLTQFGCKTDCIVYGCEVSGANISAGAVVIAGELLPFIAGNVSDTVLIREVAEKAKYKDFTERDTYFTRYAECGVGIGVALSSLTRLKTIAEVNEYTVPTGGIIMWSGSVSTIPTGWGLCDGQNGRPNLKGKFVVGYDSSVTDYNGVGKTGGADSVAITEAEMPTHSHSATAAHGGAHAHGYHAAINSRNYDVQSSGGSALHDAGDKTTDSGGSHSHVITVNTNGGGQAHENRPSYYVIAYIIKL